MPAEQSRDDTGAAVRGRWHPARLYPPAQFSRFLVFSGLAALANLAVGNLLYNLADWDGDWSYKAAVLLGFVAGMAVSFTLNRYFTFDASGRAVQHEMRTFLIVSLGGLALTVTIAASFRAGPSALLIGLLPETGIVRRLAGDVEATSHFIAVGLVAFYSFLAHKHLTFAKGLRHRLRRSDR